jgi:branched-chain amino acid transport system substrate-binding protein
MPATRRLPAVPRRTTSAALAVSTLLVAACTGGSSAQRPIESTTAVSTTSTAPRGNIDGALRIGVLLPQTGPGQQIGLSMTAAVQMAVDEINGAGGVLGRSVTVAVADEGATQEAATKALDDLLVEQRVDAIVGPASSKVALALMDKVVANRVAMCSPTASAIALSSYPDDGYFFRTMPSDELEAKTLGEVIAATGRRSTAVVYPDDEYGQRMSEALTSALAVEDNKITSVTSYDATDTTSTYFPQIASTVLQGDPASIAVIGLPDAGGKVIAALQARAATPPTIFVTDGLRDPTLFDKVQAGKPESVAGIEGISPSTTGSGASWFKDAFAAANPTVPNYYGAYAYDCANLIALAAAQAKTDDPSVFINEVAPTSRAGVDCRNFPDCAKDLQDGRNIDLNGASGRIELLPETGDATYGTYDVFEYGPDGKDQSIGTKVESLP